MNNLHMRKIFLCLFLLSLGVGSCKTLFFQRNVSVDGDKEYFRTTQRRKKSAKKTDSKSLTRTKKTEEAKKRKLDSDYKKSIKSSRKRTFDIQTPEVQARMKIDKKNISARDKAKKREIRARTKKPVKKCK